MLLKILIITFCLIAFDAKSAVSLSASSFYSNINDNRIKQDANITNSLSLGYVTKFDKVLVSASSNRLFLFETKQRARSNSGIDLVLKNKTAIDSISLGYLYKNVAPNLFVARVAIDKKIISKYGITREKNKSFVFGTNLLYFLNNKSSIGFTIVAPSKQLDLEAAWGLNFNYYF